MDEPLNLLKKYMPATFDLLWPHRNDLEQLRRAYWERKKLETDSVRRQGFFSSQVVIFDLFWKANRYDWPSRSLLSYINSKVASLLSITADRLHDQIRRLCKNMLFKYDAEHSEYTSHLAEIATIEKLVASGIFELVRVEHPLPNGKSMDFEVTNKGNISLVEVYTIDIDAEKVTSSEGLAKFIAKRSSDKLNDKLAGVDIKAIPTPYFVPVLFGPVKRLRSLASGQSWLQRQGIISPAMVFSEYKDTDGNYQFFGSSGSRVGNVSSVAFLRSGFPLRGYARGRGGSPEPASDRCA